MMAELGYQDPKVLKEEFEELLQRNKTQESRLRHFEPMQVYTMRGSVERVIDWIYIYIYI